MNAAGNELAELHGASWLIKGGHLRAADAIDVLVQVDGRTATFSAPFIPGVSTHGTGCTTSAAIAAGLAAQLPLEEAARRAKQFVTRAIAATLRWPGGTEAMDHFADLGG
jgi:hydroxymethylpyrimidine/phosphomethylpyrimidine kinase